MATFDVGNDSWIGWALEPEATPDSLADGTTPSWAAEPAFTVVGHAKLPTGKRGLNNTKGRAIGMAGAAYNRRGSVQPGVGFQFAPGSLPLVAKCLRAEGTPLAQLVIFEGVFGQWTRVYRGCKCSNISIDLGANNGQGGEVMINAQFEAVSRYELTTQPVVTPAMLRALGTPLMWHDVRQFNITGSDGVARGYRAGVNSLTLTATHTIQRTGQRANFGDDGRFPRVCEELRETGIAASGDVTFNRKVTSQLFDAAKNSQDWGNLTVVLNDGPGLNNASNAKGFTLTALNCFPTDETDGGGESNTVRTHSIPFQADNLLFALPS